MLTNGGFGRLALLAVGLGVGAAVTHSPAASADSSTDWLSLIGLDPGDVVRTAAPSTSGLDMQISIDGYDLLPTADNTASAYSGMGDFAIAVGVNSVANADFGGTGNSAMAFGNGSDARAGYVTGDDNHALAEGVDASAHAGLGNHDTATAIGGGAVAGAGGDDITQVPSDSDISTVVGTNSTAESGGTTANGPNDFALIYGNNDVANAVAGSGDYAEIYGSNDVADAANGNSDRAEVFGNMLSAFAINGNNITDIEPSSLFPGAAEIPLLGHSLLDGLSGL